MTALRLVAAMALGLAPVAALAAGADLTAPGGRWVRLFTPNIENTLGRSIRVDAASITAGGLGRTFREADVLVNATGKYPRGTTQYSLRSVDCLGGRVRLEQWQLVGPRGVTLGSSTTPGLPQRVAWDKEDGMVVRYVCKGIVPR